MRRAFGRQSRRLDRLAEILDHVEDAGRVRVVADDDRRCRDSLPFLRRRRSSLRRHVLDRVYQWVAYHLPERVAYWAAHRINERQMSNYQVTFSPPVRGYLLQGLSQKVKPERPNRAQDLGS